MNSAESYEDRERHQSSWHLWNHDKGSNLVGTGSFVTHSPKLRITVQAHGGEVSITIQLQHWSPFNATDRFPR